MAASKPALTDIPGLVALLYRADWTQLCLSAEISSRVRRPRMVRMKAGEDSWRLADEPGADEPDAEADAEDMLPRWREGLSRVLIAPGGRCRVEEAAPGPHQSASGGGGETWSRISPDEATGLHGLGSAGTLSGS
jgi:hypothetical protein